MNVQQLIEFMGFMMNVNENILLNYGKNFLRFLIIYQ